MHTIVTTYNYLLKGRPNVKAKSKLISPVRNKMSADVVEYVESEKLCQPSIYRSELQQHLPLDAIYPPGHLPSQSVIKKFIWEDCRMTKIKVFQVPKESLSQANTECTDYHTGDFWPEFVSSPD